MLRSHPKSTLLSGLILLLATGELARAQCNSYTPPPINVYTNPSRAATPGATPSSAPKGGPTPTPIQRGGTTPSAGPSGVTRPGPNAPRRGTTARRKGHRKNAAGSFDWQGWWGANSSLFLYGPQRTQITPSPARTGAALGTDRHQLIDGLNFHMCSADDGLLRQDSALTLGRIANEECVSALQKALSKRLACTDDLAESVAMGLAHTGSEIALSPLRSLVSSEEQTVRVRSIAATALGVLGTTNQETVHELMEIVANEWAHHDLRVASALALGSMRGYYSAEFLLERIAVEKSVYVGSYLLTALSLSSFPGAAPALIAATESSDPPLRWAGTLGLGGLLDRIGTLTGETADQAGWRPEELEKARKAASEQLRGLVRGAKDERTQALAALSLGRIGGPRNVAALRAITQEEHGHLRASACLGLALSADLFAEKPITTLLYDASEIDEVRAAGAAALGLLRVASPSARRTLQNALAPQNPNIIRHYACLSLGMLRNHASYNRLKKVLGNRSEDPGIRIAAARGLSLLGSPAAIQAVKLASENEADASLEKDFLGCLGSCPSSAATPILLEVMANAETGSELRAMATHAFGHVVNRHRPPLFAKLLCNRNYFLRAKPLEVLGQKL